MAQLDYPFPELPAAATRLELAPGVHWIRMPLPFALDHINLWLLDDGDEFVVIDSGYGNEHTRGLWESILEQESRRLGRVIATHHHPDHLGLASWLCARNDAPLYMSAGEFLAGQALWHQLPGYNVADMLAQFRRHGLDAERCAALDTRGNAYRAGIPAMPSTFRRLRHGETLSINGHDWQALAGYGHSPEHISLHCAKLGVLISGDMLLPRISTNVSVYAATPDDDPLGYFLASIEELCNLPADTLVLPSHGKPFKGIQPRVKQLVDHHRERCDALLAACSSAQSAAELLSTLFPRALDTHQVMFAMGEAIAHLNYLEHRGALRREVNPDGLIRFIHLSH